MSLGSWLCPTELDRSRVVDANARVHIILLVASTAIGVGLIISLPWLGWWPLILFGLAALSFVAIDRRVARSANAEILLSAIVILITIVLLGTGVAVTGGPRSPGLAWLTLPVALSAIRFRLQVVIAGLVLTVVVVLAATVGVDPGAVADNPVTVIATLTLLVVVASIVWALQAAELQNRDKAVLDPLTGLLNRHALVPRFSELAQQARLADRPVCLVLCDIDDFKVINDEHGHDRGDVVLRDVAYLLRKRLRSFELIYRLGGEEFLIVLPGIDLRTGLPLAERLRLAVEKTRPINIPVTISLGLSAGRGEEVDYETLFKAADEALYRAKRAGRNRVVAAPQIGREFHMQATPLEATVIASRVGQAAP